MSTLFDSAARVALLDRLGRLRPDSPRRWGTMTAGRMLAHLGDAFGVALGEVASPPARGPLRLAPVRWFVIRVMSWPRGRISTHPVCLTTDPTTFDADRERVRAQIERFAARGERGSFAPHPLFGTLSPALWGRLAYRHMDHHLQQFSV